MGNQSERRGIRHQEIGDRIAEIRTRINDLQQARQENRHPAASSDQLLEAQHHAAISEAAAQQALIASMEAFLQAAKAHDHAAVWHEHAAAAGDGSEEEHQLQAARHRAAAAEDRQRAETAQSFLSGSRR
ncbi:MAG TPA: hypothetical protein VH589_04925 [Trebonia sp.]